MTPRAWLAGTLSPGGQVLWAMLTGRQVPPPVPPAPVLTDGPLTGDDWDGES